MRVQFRLVGAGATLTSVSDLTPLLELSRGLSRMIGSKVYRDGINRHYENMTTNSDV